MNNQTLTIVNNAVENKSFFIPRYTTLFNGPALPTIHWNYNKITLTIIIYYIESNAKKNRTYVFSQDKSNTYNELQF